MESVSLESVERHITAIELGIKFNDLDHKVYGDGAKATKKLHALKVQKVRMLDEVEGRMAERVKVLEAKLS